MNINYLNKFADVTGVILAGGLARRMGGQDKGLIDYNGRPLIEHVLPRLTAQVQDVVINANRNLDIYANYGWQVIKDDLDGFHGPLAGMATCLARVKTPYLATVPCDTPYMPSDLIARLRRDLLANDAEICVAHDGRRIQPVFALLKAGLQDSILAYLQDGDHRTDLWFSRHRLTLSDFSDVPDAFFNINHPEDIMPGNETRMRNAL
ncbi:MAG: molybdenum cofactor guanylyltransferase [Gammaproteobacteria bacterium]|nr:MAG: molybdenum cofactor guanylyltransferase [Gammaproteobacteria bacterium]